MSKKRNAQPKAETHHLEFRTIQEPHLGRAQSAQQEFIVRFSGEDVIAGEP